VQSNEKFNAVCDVDCRASLFSSILTAIEVTPAPTRQFKIKPSVFVYSNSFNATKVIRIGPLLVPIVRHFLAYSSCPKSSSKRNLMMNTASRFDRRLDDMFSLFHKTLPGIQRPPGSYAERPLGQTAEVRFRSSPKGLTE
jgi:hypothetical protein